MEQQLNYLSIIMNHLDRISMVMTNPQLDFIAGEGSPSSAEIILDISVSFLHHIIPDELKDKEYHSRIQNHYKNTANKEISLKKDSLFILKNIINLLSRKKILLPKSSIGGGLNGG